MTPSNFFDYPYRRKGLDHSLFEMRYLKAAPGVNWGNGKKLALWLAVDVEFFPLDMASRPFVPTGGPSRPYPDIWNYSTRDYGTRVGLYRILRALESADAKATYFVQSSVAERYPVLMDDLLKTNGEIASGGIDMGHIHHSGVDSAKEEEWIRQAVDVLQQRTGKKVLGWHSPASYQSSITSHLAAAAGLEYIADWSNDDMPYPMATPGKRLIAMPLSCELNDRRILFEQHQALAAFESQLMAAFEALKEEASTDQGRILSISLSPWVIGQPYRIQALNRLLRTILSDPEVFSATASELMPSIQRSF
jgi:allantoinase